MSEVDLLPQVPGASEHLAGVLDAHFDPRWGSPFWIERAAALGFDPRREIGTLADLERLGPFPLEELARRPLEHFLPRRVRDQRSQLITAETSGTTGPPKRTAYLPAEFEAAFVEPFVRAARRTGFPRAVPWLFVGPGGPHVIGKAARACAAALGAMDPGTVDFDPRWARRLPADSLARRRYLEHVLAQATSVLHTQEVGVLFATPPVVSALGERLGPALREAVLGIHLGGVAAPPGFWREVAERFPKAVVLGGYGNSLAGVCPQLASGEQGEPAYFPLGPRLRVLVDRSADAATGRVRFHRLDLSALLPNVLERDVAAPALPPEDAALSGFGPGLLDPRPPEDAPREQAEGLY